MKKVMVVLGMIFMLVNLLTACSMPVAHLKRQPEVGTFDKTMRCDPLREHCY